MKNLKQSVVLILLTFFFIQANAQADLTYEKIKAKFWNDPDFKSKDVPDKWKNESAVILAKYYEYEVKKEVILNYIYENIYLHKRIKLLDKAAINEFSEMSFESDYANTLLWATYELKDVHIGIKVIKPSGKENIVDLKDAVLKEIKEGLNKKQYKKIAIPDLEIGDIVDYFYVIKNTYVEPYAKAMDPVFYLLVEEYPIVKQKFNVRTLRRMYFNSKSMNGAPQLKPIDKDDETFYSFEDKDREKAEEVNWAYPFRVYPTLKFQAFFIRNKVLNQLDYLKFFLKEKKENNSSVNFAEIDELVKDIYNAPYFTYSAEVAKTKSYLDKNFDKSTPSDTIVKYAFYSLRKLLYVSNNDLMLALSKVLESRKIEHDFVITVPNYLSDISDLILPQEMAYLLRIKSKPDYFIGSFQPISIYKSIESDYQGCNAYAISNPKLQSKPKVQKIVIPIDKPEDNMQTMAINIKFAGSDMDSLQVDIDKKSKGALRVDDVRLVLTSAKYEDEVDNYLARKTKAKEKPKKKSSKQQKEEKQKQQYEEQQQKDNLERLKAEYKSTFNGGEDFSISSYSLKQMGIWESSPELKYAVSFKLGNFIKKMGPNCMVEIGKFITNQLELSKKDIDRKVDVYSPFPRSFAYAITFEIPSGYKVKGIEKLNMNITNATGGFVSSAELQGNKLVINVKKSYNHLTEKVTEWPKMVEFIEAAYNFTQQNILLEKN